MAGMLGRVITCPPAQSGRMFNRPTDIVVEPASGELYIADGYGNSHIHRLSADGVLIKSFGGSGTDAGQFNCPHNLTVADGRLLVCDRENMRVQIYRCGGPVYKDSPEHTLAHVCM